MQTGELVVVVVDGEAPEVAAGLHEQLEDVVATDGSGTMQRGLSPVPLLATCVSRRYMCIMHGTPEGKPLNI